MDPVSAAASVLAISAAGVQVSIKLVSLATQISTASDRITSIGNDVSLVSGILQQLGDLMGQKDSTYDTKIFNEAGLQTTMHSANMCQQIFHDLRLAASDASMQLRACKKPTGGKFKLSVTEKAKWPFLQPKIDGLRQDLQEAKGTLMLMLQVTSLAFTKRIADRRSTGSTSATEMQEMVRTIIALHQQPRPSDSERCESTQMDHCGDEVLETAKGRGNVAAHTIGSARKSQIPTAVAPHTAVVKSGEPRKPRYSAGQSARGESTNPDSSWLLDRSDLVVEPQGLLPGSNSTSPYPNQANIPIHKDDRQSPSHTNSSDPVQANQADPMEQQIFFLEPKLQDRFDKIVLSWTVQNPKLSENAIGEHIKQHEKAGLSDMAKTLENLHPFEQRVVENAIANCRTKVRVAFALRTTSDLSTRNIRFQGVPGLHFVVGTTNIGVESCSMGPIPDTTNTRAESCSVKEKFSMQQSPRQPQSGFLQQNRFRISQKGPAAKRRSRTGQNHKKLLFWKRHKNNTSGMPMADDSLSGPSLGNTMSGSFGNIPNKDNQFLRMDLDGILAGEDLEARKVVCKLLGKYTTLYE